MDVEHDFNLSNADVLFCSETRFQKSDAKLLTEISGMYSFRNDAVKRGVQRPHLTQVIHQLHPGHEMYISHPFTSTLIIATRVTKEKQSGHMTLAIDFIYFHGRPR